MLISKFDLYKTEWLDLVFDNRNKAYGAYDLRQNYASNMIRSMGITFLGVSLLIGTAIILNGHNNQPVVAQVPDHHTIITLTEIKPLVPKKVDPPKVTTPVRTTRFVPPVVTPDPQATTPPPVISQITTAIGQTTTPGKDGGSNVLIDMPNSGTGTPGPPAPDNNVYPASNLDVMPEPIGGDAAWSKFLNKNLRFPAAAQDEGVSGKVLVSFIIEKDGNLSNIQVERPAGHGFDEEALRVLKLAKAWKPGKQNGQSVRVRYIIPINFQLNTDER
jgi:periplasmic protein TonB